MKKEIYFWIVIVAGILAAALYLRFYYAPALSVYVGFNSSASTALGSVYPYQKAVLEFEINNTGSTLMRDVGVGIYVNGNNTYVYGVTVPPGKSARIRYNYTPARSGAYNITAVVDPNRLYDISDRAFASRSVTLNVEKAAAAAPYTLIPANGIVARGASNYGISGLLLSDYVGAQYNLSIFNFSKINGLDNFMLPLLGVAASEVDRISVAYAFYGNATVYSVWMDGYVTPRLLGVAAEGRNFSFSNLTVGGRNVTEVQITPNQTLCGWYSGGWLRTLTVEGPYTCLYLLNGSAANLSAPISYQINNNTAFNGSDVVANYTRIYNNNASVAGLELFANSSLTLTSVTTNAIPYSACYGRVVTADNVSYCSSYIFPANAAEAFGPISMMRTTAYIGGYNLTALSLVNTSEFSAYVPVSIGIIKGLGISGNSVPFVSEVRNTCSFNETFGCYNLTYGNSSISFIVRNLDNRTVRLNSARCWYGSIGKATPLNASVAANSAAEVSTECYSYGNTISEIPLGLTLNLQLNYTLNKTTHATPGKAFVI